MAVNELTLRFRGDPALLQRSLAEVRSSYTATITDMTKQTRQEVQSAIALQRQRSAALVSQWKADTRASEAEEKTRARAAESLQRQRSAAIIRIWRQQEQERVRAARQAEREIEAAQQRRRAFVAGAIGGATALIGVSAISEIRNAASAWLDYSSKLESTKIAFTTMLGSAQLAEQHLKDLQQFALTTPFQFGELIDASQRMQALGFNAQQVIPILTDVGNAVAAAGGGSERLDRVVLALSQIQSKGKVATQELNQLAESGISGWKILEEQLGKSRGELIKLVEAGEISSKTFLDAFQKFSQQNFGGLMEAQSKTFAGAMSNIKDALLQTSATAFAPLYERISETARELAKLSTSSKEFQENLTTAGRQVITVWEGVVEVFHTVQDVIGLVGAVAVQIFGGVTHVILATVEAVKGYYYGLQAVAQFMAGNFRTAQELANKSTQATENAANELTQALKAQGAVAEQVVRIWENAEARKAAASISAAQKIAAAQLGSTYSGPDRVGGSLTLSGGLQPGAARGVGVGSGKGKRGGTKKSTFLADATEDAKLTEREVRQKLDADVAENKRAYEEQARDIEEYTRRAIDLAEQRHDAVIVRINAEIAALDSAFAKKLIKEREYNQKNRELDIENEAARRAKDDEVWEAEQKRDRDKAAAEFAAHQRSAQIAEEASDRLIQIIRDKVDNAVISESEGERQISELIAQGFERRKALLEDELTRITTSLERKREINDQLIMLDGQRAYEAERAADRIEAARQRELPGRPRRIKDATRPRSVEEEEFGVKPPPELSIWEEALDAIQSRMQEFHEASKMYVVDAFHGMAEAATSAIEAWILYGGSLGKALKQAVAAELAAVAARAAVQAMLHAAYAIGSLAFGNFAAAAQHGIAAAKFAAIAALTGVAARGLAGSAAASASGASTASGAFQSATQVGAGSTAGKPTTTDVNRRAIAEPQTLTRTLEFKVRGDAVVQSFVEDYNFNGRTRVIIKSDGQG